MKRPKLKRASKRLSCSKRYKIQRKVREHNRKLRKEAKKKGVSKRVKKDLGVPSSAPFKEEVLREAEQRRLQVEEEKEQKRQAKKEERAQKRQKDKQVANKETEPKAKKARRDDPANHSTKQTVNKSSKQFLCAELNKVIDASNVVIEVLDARDPLGCRCPQLEEAVLQRGGNKKLLLVLNKIDLVPKENVEQWIDCLQQEFPVVAFKASTQIRDRTVQAKKSRIVASNEVLDKSRGAACFGSDCLTELLTSYAAKSQNEAALKVGVVGFTNVGKSSLINSMKGMFACNAGVKRGITKSMQEVHISKTVKLMDSPGVVVSPSNPRSSLVLRSPQVEEGHESVLDAVTTLLKQCEKTQIMLQYNVPDFRNSLEFLTLLAKKRGYLQKGATPNTEQAASVFLADWTGAKLSYHCKVPGSHHPPPYMTDSLLADMQKDWDLSKLRSGNEETLKGVKFPNQASSITFTSKGPTEGVMTVIDVSEEQPSAAAAEGGGTQQQDEPDQTAEDSNEAEESEKPQKTSLEKKPKRVQFQSVPIDISLSAGNPDDAYDFNTDFK